MADSPRSKATKTSGNTRPPRTRRRRLLTWRRFLAACVIVPIALVAALTRMPTTRWVYATGYVMTAHEAELRPSVEGAIAERLVNSGDEVQAGQPVIRLHDLVEVAAHEQAVAQLRAKQAQLKQLRNAQKLENAQRKEQIYQAEQSLALAAGNLDRIQEANKSGAVFSRRETEDAHLNVELASSRLKELQLTRDSVMASQIEVLEEQIGSAGKNAILRKAERDMRQICSPMRGTIRFNRFVSGEVVQSDDVLAQVFDRRAWIIKLTISERWISHVQAAQDVDVTLTAFPQFRFGYLPAQITSVWRVVTPHPTGDGVFYAEATVLLPEQFDLEPGMSASARINTGPTNWLFRLIGW